MTTSSAPRTPLVLLVLTLVGLEVLAAWGATAFLLFELVTDEPASVSSAVALAITVGVMAAGITLLWVGLIKRWRAVRGGVVLWQILQIAVAVLAFQVDPPRPDLGWLLLAPSIAVLALMFTKPVLAATGAATPAGSDPATNDGDQSDTAR